MKRAALLMIPLLAGCGREEGEEAAGRQSRAPVQVAELTGFYQAGGKGEQSARMCMISESSGAASFGIVTETPNGGSCGGAGEAVRDGKILRLTMAGDEACAIEAQIDGSQVTLPTTLPAGCAYYCGPGATLAGATLAKTGGTADDAKRALDLAGDPLCG